MYKVKHNLCPKIIQELFIPSICSAHKWVLPKVRTVNKDLKIIRSRGPKTWEIVHTEIKNSKSFLPSR